VYRIESCRLLLYWPTLRASLQVQQLLTGPINTADQRTFATVTRCLRARHLIHDTGEGWRGKRRETKTDAVLGLGHQRQMTPHPIHEHGSDNNNLNCQSYNHTNVSTN